MLKNVSLGQILIVSDPNNPPLKMGKVVKILDGEVQVRMRDEVRSFSKETGQDSRNAFLYAYPEEEAAAKTGRRAATLAKLTAGGATLTMDFDPAEPSILHVHAIEGLLDIKDRLRGRIWLTDNGPGWASDLRRRMLGGAVEFTKFGFYDLGPDNRYRRYDDPGQGPVGRREMD